MKKTTTDLRPPEHRLAAARPGQPTTGQPYIDPAVLPRVAAYAEGLDARAGGRRGPVIPKYAEPVGGGKAPPIPRLDAAAISDRPMSEQAEHVNSPSIYQQLASGAASRAASIVEVPGRAPQGPPMPTGLDLRTTDMLPPEAQQDPEFQHGGGAAYAVSQPRLAARYGVIRDGHRLLPQQLQTVQGSKPQLSAETIQGLQDLMEAQRKVRSAEQVRSAEEAAEKQVEGSAASMSASAGSPIAPSKDQEMTDDERQEAQRRLEMMDSFDYDSLRQAITRDVLNNPDQREIIEKRLQPLDIDDLILKNRVAQRVPIVPSKFEVTYTSMTGQDDLALKRLIMQESKSVEVTERYLLDKYAFMALTCGLTAVNGNSLPSHLNDRGEFDEARFWKKFEWVMQRPLHMLSSIGVNHTWFEMRVRKMFVAEKLGNT